MDGRAWSDGLWLTAILAVAFLMRLGCAIGVQRHLDHGSREVCLIPGDADGYWQLSHKILRGENFELYTPPRRVMRMPGFSFLLALPQFVFGENLLAVRIWLAIISTGGCWFVYLLGKELCDVKVGRWAAAVIAISPVHTIFSVLLLSEAAFAVALTASLFFYARLHRSLAEPEGSFPFLWAILTGLMLAVATYLRPTWLLIGPLAAVGLLVGRATPFAKPQAHATPFRFRFAAAALLMLGMFGALLPWAMRNQSVSGHFTFTTFWVGPSLYDGLRADANGDSDMTFFDQDRLLDRMSEYDMDREYRRRAWEFARENPRRTVQLMFIKLSRFWMFWPNAAQFRALWMQAIVAVSFSIILIPALVGTWKLRRRWDILAITWGPVLYFAAVHTLFVGSIRYRLPAEYPLAVLAGVGWSTIYRTLFGDREVVG